MSDSNQIEIVMDSKFLKKYKSQWEELILFKSGICDYLLNDAIKIEEMKKGEYTEVETKNLYIEFIKKFINKSDLLIEGWAGNTASGIDGEDYNIGFNFIPQSKREIDGKIIANKKLIIKFDKGQEAYVEFKNIEKLFFIENINEDNNDSISSIDYSKSFMQLKNIKILDNLIETTSKSDFNKKANNKEFGIEYINLKKSLENKSIGDVDLNSANSDEKNEHFFSPFLGISIKSLTINDIHKIPLQANIFKKELNTATVNIRDILKNEKNYDSEIVEWVKANTIKYTSGGYSLQAGLIGNYLDGKITLEESRFTININTVSFNSELKNGNKVFTVCYFSPFKKEDNDTYFKKEIISNHEVKIYADNNDIFYAETNLSKQDTSTKYSVKCINSEELKKNLEFNDRIFSSSSRSIRGKSNISSFVELVEYKNGEFIIVLKINKIKDGVYTRSFINNTEQYGEYHLFVPEIYFETFSGRIEFNKQIDGSQTIETESGGEFITITYTLSIENIIGIISLKEKEAFRILSPFYHSKWFFLENNEYKNFNNKTNFKFKKYNNVSDIIDRFNTNIIIDGKNIENTGIANNEPNKINNQGDLEGEGEKILKVSENSSGLEESEIDNAISGENSDFSRLDRLNAAKDALSSDSNELILNFVELNKISKTSIMGEDNSKDFKDVSYDFKINPYDGRRGNVQPKLLWILSKALEITQKTYPSLKRVIIMSSSIVPIDISVYVYYLKKNQNNDLNQIKQKVNLVYPGLGEALTEETINQIIDSFISKGADMNHALGFGADVFLKRTDTEGKEKFVCLWQPNDNDDFNIVKAFLQSCLDLGATGAGAGIYYMNYPEFVKHLTQKTINKVSKNKVIAKKFKAEYDEIYKKYNIEPAVSGSSTINKFIIDNDGLPIRRLGDPKNAFHIQIFGMDYSYYESAFEKLNIDIDKIDEINKKSKNEKNLITLRQRIKAKSKVRFVWGESYGWETADKWLKDLVGNKRTSNVTKSFDKVEEITKENVKEISKEQFEVIHTKSDDKGQTVTEYVNLKEVQKNVSE